MSDNILEFPAAQAPPSEEEDAILRQVNALVTLDEDGYNMMVDQLESQLAEIEMPEIFKLEHEFGDGLYQRTIAMPTGALLTSKIHAQRHPFTVHAGAVFVISQGHAEFICAPFKGWTEPGTRRILLVANDCVWSTVHANPDNGQDLAKIEERIIVKRERTFTLPAEARPDDRLN